MSLTQLSTSLVLLTHLGSVVLRSQICAVCSGPPDALPLLPESIGWLIKGRATVWGRSPYSRAIVEFYFKILTAKVVKLECRKYFRGYLKKLNDCQPVSEAQRLALRFETTSLHTSQTRDRISHQVKVNMSVLSQLISAG